MQKNVEQAIEVLRNGGLILYPTDTVWGIGCDATNAEAVAKVYALKRSEDKKSMLVLCVSPRRGRSECVFPTTTSAKSCYIALVSR